MVFKGGCKNTVGLPTPQGHGCAVVRASLFSISNTCAFCCCRPLCLLWLFAVCLLGLRPRGIAAAVFVSDDFVDMTGYNREEINGINCRFLQVRRECLLLFVLFTGVDFF